MPSYSFENISPIDFEYLTRDLLQKHLGIPLESFKSGRDKGIDLRFSSFGMNQIVIQCKHYSRSRISDLLSSLKKEVEKARRLDPERYILSTSLPLGPEDKDKIQNIFGGYIINTGDVYGREDLNNLLGQYPDIERKNFKLWMQSVGQLESLIHARSLNVSRDLQEAILRKAKIYVQHDGFDQASQLLNDHNICLIAGAPGIGKTTLAEMLVLAHVQLGYELVKIESDISEAASLDHKIKPRVYYYDDFLGQTAFGEKLNKNEDKSLLDFMKSVQESKSSKLILTTREYILNQAQATYERIARADFNPFTYVVDLSKYTRRIRTEILYNHLYFSSIPKQYHQALVLDKHIRRIVDHPNYNPRIIEMLTTPSRLVEVRHEDYGSWFMQRLDSPQEIWEHAFMNQISEASRYFLLFLCTFRALELKNAEQGFNQFCKERLRSAGLPCGQNEFKKALKELSNSFIKTEMSQQTQYVSLFNPSIRDYLLDFLPSQVEEVQAVVRTTPFFEQLVTLWQAKNKDGSFRFRSIVNKRIEEFVDALGRTIGAQSCGVSHIQNQDGETFLRRNELSFEERLGFILELLEDQKNERFKQLLADHLSRFGNRIQGIGEGKPEVVQDTWNVFRGLFANGLIHETSDRDLFDQMKEFLIVTPSFVQDFQSFFDYSSLLPNLVIEEDYTRVHEYLVEVAIGEIESCEDPDELRSDCRALKSLAICSGFTLDAEISMIEDRIKKLEDEVNAWDDYYEGTSQVRNAEPQISDNEIESIFESLISRDE